MKLLIIILFFVLNACTNKTKSEPTLKPLNLDENTKKSITLTGTLEDFSFAKSVDSYCASYLLKDNNDKQVLLDMRNYHSDDIKLFINKEVKITGYYHIDSKRANSAPDEMIGQHPIMPTSPFDTAAEMVLGWDCELFLVEKMIAK